MTESGIKPRSDYLDNIKGILIMLVCFGHFLFDYQDNKIVGTVVQIIYLFHMPAFVFVSGYLSKSKNSRSAVSLLKLFAAYFLFNGLFLAMNIVQCGNVSITVPYLSYWYLIAMIVWRLSIEVISKIKFALPISVALALFIGFCPEVDNTLAMCRIISLYPFFLWGYKLDAEKIKRYGENKKASGYFIGLVLLAVVVVAGLLTVKVLPLTDFNLTFGPYENLKEFAVRIAVLVISVIAIYMLLMITVDKRLPLITMAGRNSLSIFLIHRVLPLIYVKIVARVFGDNPSAVLILSTAFVCTLFVMLLFGLDVVNTLIKRVTAAGADMIIPSIENKTTIDKLIQLCYIMFAIMLAAFIIYRFL